MFRSDDGGDSWIKVLDKNINLNTYETYLRALAIHPTDPDTLWFGGVTLRRSDDGGATWSNLYHLHPDHHGLYVWSDSASPTGVGVYVAGDGGLYVGDGTNAWDDSLQDGLGVALFQSISTTPGSDTVIGGLQDNGTNYAVGFLAWDHINDGDAASTIIDSNGPSTFYDVYIGNRARRCTSAPYGCGYNWPAINAGLGGPVAWYPPFLEDPTALPANPNPLLPPAEYPLYFGNQIVNRSINNGSTWGPLSGIALAQPIGPDVDVPLLFRHQLAQRHHGDRASTHRSRLDLHRHVRRKGVAHDRSGSRHTVVDRRGRHRASRPARDVDRSPPGSAQRGLYLIRWTGGPQRVSIHQRRRFLERVGSGH